MELRHLRYFCAVAERQSFTLAARQLHVSQSGVSGQVKDLEDEIGVRLLQRNRRAVSLTAEGELLFREAQEILARSEQAIERVVHASEGRRGKLTVGLCGPATAPFLPGLIRDFRQRHPEVDLELKDLEPAQQPCALAEGLIDIGFTRSVPPEFRKVLQSELLFREPLLAALPKGHPLSEGPGLRLAQLAAERLIFYSREAAPELFDALVFFCKRARFSPRVVGSPRVWHSVLMLVEAGEGVALVPGSVRYLVSKGVVFRPILDRRCSLDVVLAWRRQEASGLRDSFLGLIQKQRSGMEGIMRHVTT